MTNIYYDQDADLSNLDGKRIGIIGYGNQGRAQALNMRDSGISEIFVGTARDETFTQAREDGFNVDDIPEVVPKADILFLLIPDEIMPEVYHQQIQPHLEPGNVLNFASGYNITFEHIIPPPEIDTIMVAPRMIGDGVRNNFLNGEGFPAFIAVEQDSSGEARQTALALAKAMGATKMGSIEVTFKDETMLDLLAEQAIWPMIISILTEAFHFEVERGTRRKLLWLSYTCPGNRLICLRKWRRMASSNSFLITHIPASMGSYHVSKRWTNLLSGKCWPMPTNILKRESLRVNGIKSRRTACRN